LYFLHRFSGKTNTVMLLELHIENLAIIERVDLSFGKGFNVLTGETGAGKSILLDAIGLVLGERADTAMVRTGASRTVVSAVFDMIDLPDAPTFLTELGLETEEGLLYLMREVQEGGRSIARINGQPVPLATLKILGDVLVDLHGQHEHQSLLRLQSHLDFLDHWLGEEVLNLRARLREGVQQLHTLQRELEEFAEREREWVQMQDLYQFQHEEISNARLQPDEEESLLQEEQRLTHAEKLVALASTGYENLMGDGSAYDHLAEAVRALEEIARIDASMEEQLEPLQAALVQTKEAGSALRDYSENVEYNPERLDEVVSRLELIKRLKRKYGDTLEAILQYQAEIAGKLGAMEHQSERKAQIEAELQQLEGNLQDMADLLSEKRHKGAHTFSNAVQSELHDLAMERAMFAVQVNPKGLDTTGVDAVEFLLAPNPGEALKPLNKIASGGEMSRVMLTLKTVLAKAAPVPTLIFDEIDAGLGGRTAHKVGEKLERLQDHFQVLCVTHLPQIACRARYHYQITKQMDDERTLVQVGPLEYEERVLELARMLAGEETETAIQHARELLETARIHV
jgi:DNA repair protein RecN (Recombination protein N)